VHDQIMTRYFKVDAAAPSPRSARYSHAVEAGGLLFITGQLPVDPADPGAPVPSTIGAQADLVFRNLALIAEAAGYSLADTVFARIYLTHFDEDYETFNDVFHRYLSDDDRLPGRTTVGVAKLGRNARVEIDLTLAKSQ
jgi:2-iminobutanoate/2-iminopropanoate deaminase